uniref:Minor capsid protein VP1 n=2 Tax=Canine minute virus TaxID=329639 RepID=E1CES5_9VIRU|nr:structural protein [Canine minute virus]
MAPPNRKPGGWVVPGYKYLGPFNPLDNGTPINKVDKAAQKHDFAYQSYINKGENPYLNFNKADSDFIEDLKNDSSFAGWLGKSAFRLKRILAPHLKENTPPAKRVAGNSRQDRAQKRKLYFARSNKNSKQARMEPQETENTVEADAGIAGRAGGGGGPGGGGSGGGSGVGVSTGGWEGGTLFGDNRVITVNTRQWYAPIYNGHRYTKLEGTGNTFWKGIKTPWGYFNFNAYDSHFSPQDWQRLTNEYRRWRPKKMMVKIYNLQIKQVVTLQGDTLYNNDLTAGVHIFCDGSHQYPYSQHPWDAGTMPELPYKVWLLENYGYFQFQGDLIDTSVDSGSPDVENVKKEIAKSAPFYILENANHEVLRTGEETNFHFTFDCGWVNNDRAYCPLQADFNPLVKTRRYFATRNNYNNSGKFVYTRYSPYNKPSQWMPGPSLGYIGNTQSAATPEQALGPITVVTAPPGTSAYNASTEQQSKTNQQSASNATWSGYDVSPVNCARSGFDKIGLAYDSAPESELEEKISIRDIDNNMSRWGQVFVQDGTNKEISNDNTGQGGNTRQNMAELKNVWMFPNQAWDSTPISRDFPIWVKSPNTDKHTLFDSSDGTLPMSHPPGTIFVKVAKIPIPTQTNTDSYLTLYVTGQVTCTIEWEVERFMTKNWRPESKNDVSSFRDAFLYTVGADGTYNTPERFLEGMPTRRGINKTL